MNSVSMERLGQILILKVLVLPLPGDLVQDYGTDRTIRSEIDGALHLRNRSCHNPKLINPAKLSIHYRDLFVGSLILAYFS